MLHDCNQHDGKNMQDKNVNIVKFNSFLTKISENCYYKLNFDARLLITMDKYENKHVNTTETKLIKKARKLPMRGCCLYIAIDFQGQMSMVMLTMDKYRNNLVGTTEIKPMYLDQSCDTWLPLMRKICLLHKRSRSQLTILGWSEMLCPCISPVIHVSKRK